MRYQSRNPLIRPHILESLALLKELDRSTAYRGIIAAPPADASAAVQARCYLTAKQASQLIRDLRYQTKRKRRLIIDRPTQLSGDMMCKALAPDGMSRVRLFAR